MTLEQLKTRLEKVEAARDRLDDLRYVLHLAIEEAEGRPNSPRAKFARAAIAHDCDAMDRLCAETHVAYRKQYGPNAIEREVERILAEDRAREAANDS